MTTKKTKPHPDTRRLNYLINWLGVNDDVQTLPVRDWVGRADARIAIDEAMGKRLKSAPRSEKRNVSEMSERQQLRALGLSDYCC